MQRCPPDWLEATPAKGTIMAQKKRPHRSRWGRFHRVGRV